MIETKIRGLIQKAMLRLRLQQFLEGFATGAVPTLALGGLGFMVENAGWATMGTAGYGILAAIPFVWGAAHVAVFRINPHKVAVDIDESNTLHARLTSAYCFTETPKAERTPFMLAAIRDAEEKIKTVNVAQAAPFSVPRDSIVMAAAGLCLLSYCVHPPVAPALPVVVEEALPEPEAPLEEHQVDAAKERWDEVRVDLLEDPDANTKKMVAELDELYDKLDKRELSKEEFLSEIDRVDDKFFDNEKSDWTTFEDELKDLAKDFEKDSNTKDLADALKKGDLDKAAKEIEDLANKVADGKMSDKAIEKLAKNLDKMGDKLAKNADALAEKLKKKEDELAALKKKLAEKSGDLSKKDKQKLSRLGRDFDKLKGLFDMFGKSGQKKAKKKLASAAKKAADGARKAKKRGKGAAKGKEARADAKRKLKQGAKAASSELKHTKKKAKGEKAKKRAKNDLNRVKQAVKRARVAKKGAKGKEGGKEGAKGKKGQTFEQRAGGKKPQKTKKPGQQSAAAGQEGKAGKEGKAGSEGKSGKEGKAGASGKGGQPESAGAKGDGKAKKGNSTAAGEGKEFSETGAGGDALGKSEDLQGASFKKASVEGEDSGEGASKAEVISAAAEKGFAGRKYAEIHTEYEHVAEEALEKESIPAGYRFYIQSYFERIRPRKADE